MSLSMPVLIFSGSVSSSETKCHTAVLGKDKVEALGYVGDFAPDEGEEVGELYTGVRGR
jgi:hypothetical protein